MTLNFSQSLEKIVYLNEPKEKNRTTNMETNKIITVISKFVTFFDLQVRNQTEIRKLAEKCVELAFALDRVNRIYFLFHKIVIINRTITFLFPLQFS